MQSKFISVRGRLIGLVALSILPILALIVFNGIEQRANAIDRATNDAYDYINEISRDQSIVIEKTEQILNALAILPPINDFRVSECTALLSEMIREYQSYVSFTVFDRMGNLQCSGPPATRTFNIADRTHFQNAINSKTVAVGDYVISRLLGTPSVYIAHPIKNDSGDVVGTVNAGLDLKWLDRLVRANQLKFGAKLTLFDRKGTVFAHYTSGSAGETKVGGVVPDFDVLRKYVENYNSGIIRIRENEEKEIRVIKSISATNINDYFYISMPLDIVLADVNAIFKRNLLLLFVVSLSVMALAWFMGGYFISRFVDLLVSATRKLHAGDLSVRTNLPPGNSEFHELASDFDSMAGALEQREAERTRLIDELEIKNAELERFVYTVSHELKSPLVTIAGFSGMLKRDIATGDRGKLEADIERINSAVATMSRLLDDLLELSRIGRVTSAPVSVPLAELASEVVRNVKSRPALAETVIEIEPDLPVIVGDRERLREVLQNLVENAIKFCKDEPRIEIGSRRQAGEEVIFVKDNGPGIEPEYQEKVFDLFERLDHSIEGTGIGLARVHRIIEEHGGRVWVESEGSGKGSSFCFSISPRQNSQATLRAVGGA